MRGNTSSGSDEPTRILRLPDILAVTGLSRSTIYQQMEAGLFPRQVALGVKAVGWRENEVNFWIETRTCEVTDKKTVGQRKEGFNDYYLYKVDRLELSARSANCLKTDNIIYIGDLVQKTEAELLRIRHCGRRSVTVIKAALARMDLHLGTEINDWPPKTLETDSSTRKTTSTRITPEVRVLLEEAAALSGRSLAQEIEIRLEQSFQDEGVISRELGGADNYDLAKLLFAVVRLVETETGRSWRNHRPTFQQVTSKWSIFFQDIVRQRHGKVVCQ